MNIASCEMRRDGPSGIGRHRAAEIVASQGAASPALPVVDPLSKTLTPIREYSRPQPFASSPYSSGSFVSPPGMASYGYPYSPYSSRQNQQQPIDAFGGHLPCTAAALSSEDTSAAGRGLYVSMQRGMGKAQTQEEKLELLPRRPAKIRSESPGRMMTAAKYIGADEDPIDEALAAECKRLPEVSGKVLNIRRIAPGEYEVDGVPVRLSWQEEIINNTSQVVVHRLGEEDQGAEALSRYLPRAANEALRRSPPEAELPSFPWSVAIDALTTTMNPRKMRPSTTPTPSAPTVSRPMMPISSPQGASLQLQQPHASVPRINASFLLPPRGNTVTRSPSLIVPVPGMASHNLPMPHRINR